MKRLMFLLVFVTSPLCAEDVSINFNAQLEKNGLATTQFGNLRFDVSEAGVEVVEIAPTVGGSPIDLTFNNLTDPQFTVVYVDVTTTNSQQVQVGVNDGGFRRVLAIKEGESWPLLLDTNLTLSVLWPANETNSVRAIGWAR